MGLVSPHQLLFDRTTDTLTPHSRHIRGTLSKAFTAVMYVIDAVALAVALEGQSSKNMPHWTDA